MKVKLKCSHGDREAIRDYTMPQGLQPSKGMVLSIDDYDFTIDNIWVTNFYRKERILVCLSLDDSDEVTDKILEDLWKAGWKKSL